MVGAYAGLLPVAAAARRTSRRSSRRALVMLGRDGRAARRWAWSSSASPTGRCARRRRLTVADHRHRRLAAARERRPARVRRRPQVLPVAGSAPRARRRRACGSRSEQLTVFVVVAAADGCFLYVLVMQDQDRQRDARGLASTRRGHADGHLDRPHHLVHVRPRLGASRRWPGVLIGMAIPKIDPLMGIMYGLKAFVAAVLGGIGNIPGALLGGLLIGLAETFVVGLPAPRPTATPSRSRILIVLLLVPAAGPPRRATRRRCERDAAADRHPAAAGRSRRGLLSALRRAARLIAAVGIPPYPLRIIDPGRHQRDPGRVAEPRSTASPASSRSATPASWRSAPTARADRGRPSARRIEPALSFLPAGVAAGRGGAARRLAVRRRSLAAIGGLPGGRAVAAPARRLPGDRDPGLRRDHPRLHPEHRRRRRRARLLRHPEPGRLRLGLLLRRRDRRSSCATSCARPSAARSSRCARTRSRPRRWASTPRAPRCSSFVDLVHLRRAWRAACSRYYNMYLHPNSFTFIKSIESSS